MVDQTLPEIAEVQSENKARKRQKDNYNKAVEAIANLDAKHLEKLCHLCYYHLHRVSQPSRQQDISGPNLRWRFRDVA